MQIPLLCKDKKFFVQTFFLCASFFLAAHGFCFANSAFSGQSLMINASSGYRSYMENGQFLIPLYLRLRGSLAAPSWIGMLSFAYLFISAWFILILFDRHSVVFSAAVCSCLFLIMPVTAINASMLHLADTYYLSLFLNILATVLCICVKWGWIPSAAFSFLSFSLQPTLFPVLPILVIIFCIDRILNHAKVRNLVSMISQSFLSVFLGFFMHCSLLIYRGNLHPSLISSGLLKLSLTTPFTALFSPFRAFFAFPTAYPVIQCILFVVLLATACLSLVFAMRRLPVSQSIALIVLLFLSLLWLSIPFLPTLHCTATREQLALFLIPLTMIILLSPPSVICTRHRLRSAGISVLVVLSTGSIVFTNQVYLKKNLEMHATLSAFTRVISLAEQTPGFIPGETPVALLGTLEESVLADGLKGFEHVEVLDAASNTFVTITPEDNTWYVWSILGYPFNLVSNYELKQIEAIPEVQTIPPFPASESCRFINDTLVIRLSD